MVEQNDLRAIIEQVLSEMNVSKDAAPAAVAQAVSQVSSKTSVDDGFIPDVTEVDIKSQYLVDNPGRFP